MPLCYLPVHLFVLFEPKQQNQAGNIVVVMATTNDVDSHKSDASIDGSKAVVNEASSSSVQVPRSVTLFGGVSFIVGTIIGSYIELYG